MDGGYPIRPGSSEALAPAQCREGSGAVGGVGWNSLGSEVEAVDVDDEEVVSEPNVQCVGTGFIPAVGHQVLFLELSHAGEAGGGRVQERLKESAVFPSMQK